MAKSVEQKLYEALRNNTGVLLNARDVESLVRDDAIGTRITNRAWYETGLDEPGMDDAWVAAITFNLTWHQFKQQAHGKSSGIDSRVEGV